MDDGVIRRLRAIAKRHPAEVWMDEAVAERILGSPALVQLLADLELFGEREQSRREEIGQVGGGHEMNLGFVFLERCMSLRDSWEQLPKVPERKARARAVKLSGYLSSLADWLEKNGLMPEQINAVAGDMSSVVAALEEECWRALKTDQLCSLKIDQGWKPGALAPGVFGL
ncbi:MAG: hypothetical protein Q8L99_06205 [Polycyclovorans sp.]|jgi:hypothetical protein|nr:hypothetical protein [Polycyclovorans sp.]